MLLIFQKLTFSKRLYGENDGPSIQGKLSKKHIFKLQSDESLCRILSKSIKKIVPQRPFHRAIDETLKIPEKCWHLNFTRVLQFRSNSPSL